MTIEAFWNNCIGHLRGVISSSSFDAFVDKLSASMEGSSLVVYVDTNFAFGIVKDRFASEIESYARENYAEATEVLYRVGRGEVRCAPEPELAMAGASRQAQAASQAAHGVTASEAGSDSIVAGAPTPAKEEGVFERKLRLYNEREERKRNPIFTEIQSRDGQLSGDRYNHTRLNPDFTFENFVVGDENSLPYNVGLDLKIHLGRRDHNPFIIYGSTGLGKTHLVNAIGNEIFKSCPDKRIKFFHAEDYVKDYVRASRANKIDEFIKPFLELDLLILDDVQFLAGKLKSMEEFFYIFGQLTTKSRQIILTCDTIPSELENMHDRLVSRFMSGLTAEILPPNCEMRMEILKKKAEMAGIELGNDVAFYLADNIRSNVRDLEGALNLISAHIRYISGSRKVDINMAKKILGSQFTKQVKRVTIKDIQDLVCDYYHVGHADLVGKSRVGKTVKARHMAMVLCRNHTKNSLASIGQDFGKHHTVVLNACKKFQENLEKDELLRKEFEALTQMLES